MNTNEQILQNTAASYKNFLASNHDHQKLFDLSCLPKYVGLKAGKPGELAINCIDVSLSNLHWADETDTEYEYGELISGHWVEGFNLDELRAWVQTLSMGERLILDLIMWADCPEHRREQ